MASVNKVILIGNLGADPEVRYTQNSQAVANFRIATTDVWTDREGNKQERTEWHNIVAWGKLGEICGQYLKKGKQIYVEGRIQTRQWEDKEGGKRYTTEVVANIMQMLGRPGEGEGGGGGGRAGSARRRRRWPARPAPRRPVPAPRRRRRFPAGPSARLGRRRPAVLAPRIGSKQTAPAPPTRPAPFFVAPASISPALRTPHTTDTRRTAAPAPGRSAARARSAGVRPPPSQCGGRSR